MTIPIGGIGSQPRLDINEFPLDRVTSSGSNKAHESSDAASAAETTTLTSGAASVATLTAAAMSDGGIRSDKVDQLRQAIKAGEYNVDPNAVADAMIKDSQR
jgi:flagellar biosynthesis anti-sigma factor FlgM